MALPEPPSDLIASSQSVAPSGSLPQEVSLWTPARLDLLKRTITKDLTDDEFSLFIEVCRSRRLNPFVKQVYAIKRSGRLVIQTSIDGFRLTAERSGKYLGQTPPYWCGKDGKWVEVWPGPGNPFAAKVGVLKEGRTEPTWGIAYWDMYVAEGPFWKKGGAPQLAKCAEALALRKAFPEELSGLYTGDEMQQAEPVIEAEILPADDPTPKQIPIIIQKVLQTWPGWVLIEDASGEQYIFTEDHFEHVKYHGFDPDTVSNAILITYVIESGRKVVQEVA